MAGHGGKNNKKKALAVVTGPYTLMQVFWVILFYTNYEWSVVLHRYGESKEQLLSLKEHCVRSGCFQDVYIMENTPLFLGTWGRIVEFIKMFFYFLTQKRKKYCKRLIESCIGKLDYDLLCVPTSYSVFSGALLNYSDEIPTIILQDGLADYVQPKMEEYGFCMNIIGRLLFYMKYVNFLALDEFYFQQYCIKYATDPERLRDKNFMEIRRLFDENKVSPKEYEDFLREIYQVGELNYDVVVFTYLSQSLEANEDHEKLRRWLGECFKDKKILIKKHPRDTNLYHWSELNITCQYTEIPGEIIIKLAKNAKFIFSDLSTLLLSVIYEEGYDYEVIKYVSGMTKSYQYNVEQLLNWLKIEKDRYVEL